MVGAISVVDSHTGPCLCSTSMNLKTGGELVSQMKRKQGVGRAGCLELGSSFVDSCHDWRLSSKMIPGVVNKKSSRKARTLVVVNELGGQYEETFGDVKTQLLNYFTYKAVRTVLTQLYEMNPPKYTWFYQYVAANQPTDGKSFLRILGKKCDHAQIYKEISDENLELMRERLKETVVWPSDDSNTDTIG
ncbi:hypothetical protein E1A91_A09G123900v1 [Gossypium mustelinum]|uniref:Chaperonin-like RbcX protein n=1 Tax=Gossypium mustelinum TaxID=34275 RepID=A0A5D2XX91_GOSMU|nr:hypothetical protein E1A91_A09G123900v1 [Gossypium mustelinum]